MPYLPTAQQWLTQSTLLIQAHPSTTRITTKYTHASTISKKTRPRRSNPNNPSTSTTPSEPTALLTLKTYDPTSGATLKYQTNKAAEVGRLIQILGRLGRGMAGLEMKSEQEAPAVGGGVKPEEESAVGTPVVEADKQLGGGAAKSAVGPAAGGGGGGGGKGKKKKGKK